MPLLAHVINPVSVGAESDLHVAQPITFETMRRAQAFARVNEGVEVALLTAQYPEDRIAIPGFTVTPDLNRSVLDFGAFTARRKLPLVGDLLERAYAASNAEYVIYTNVDIALKPDFYTAVAGLLRNGLEAAVINRRTVSATPAQARDLDWLYQQSGDRHPGWDCFIFRRALVQNFDFGALVIGAVPVGQAILAVLSTLAERFELLEDAFLTFHLNDDQAWRKPIHDQFHLHNFKEAQKILAALEARKRLSSFALELKKRVKEELGR